MSETNDPGGRQWPGGGYGPPSGYSAAPAAAALASRSRPGGRRRMSSPAKKIIAVFLAIGAVAVGGLLLANVLTGGNSFNKALALRQVEAANRALTKNSQGFESAVQTCSGQLPCVTGLLRTQAQALETFNTQIKGIAMTGRAASDAAALVSQDNAALQELGQLAASKSNVQYMNIVRTNSLQQALKNAAAAYVKLVQDLGGIAS